MRSLLVVIAVLIIAAPALATTSVTFQPGEEGKDASILEKFPSLNFGDNENLWFGYDNGWTDTLIEFEDLDNYIGATVTYAELGFYTHDGWGTKPSVNWIVRIYDEWDEMAVTWDDAPSINSDVEINFDCPNVGQWLKVDVTAIVETWLNGSFPHFGFYMGTDDEVDGGRKFYSSDAADPTRWPYLYMEYTGTGVAPASLGHIKATFN